MSSVRAQPPAEVVWWTDTRFCVQCTYCEEPNRHGLVSAAMHRRLSPGTIHVPHVYYIVHLLQRDPHMSATFLWTMKSINRKLALSIFELSQPYKKTKRRSPMTRHFCPLFSPIWP
ncbi:hypothetical protein BDW67DRAFT_95841 [Aspergillus spinulosporus]